MGRFHKGERRLIQSRVPADVHALVLLLARERGMCLSDYVAELLYQHVDRPELCRPPEDDDLAGEFLDSSEVVDDQLVRDMATLLTRMRARQRYARRSDGAAADDAAGVDAGRQTAAHDEGLLPLAM